MQLVIYFDIDDNAPEEEMEHMADSILSDFKYYDPEVEGIDLRSYVKGCSYRLYTDQ